MTSEASLSPAAMVALEQQTMVAVNSVLELRKILGEPLVSATILRNIESIQENLSKRTDQQGWQRVDWRTKGGGYSGGGGGGGGGRDGGAGGNSSHYRNFQAPAPRGGTMNSGGATSPPPSGPPPKYMSHFKHAEKPKDAVLLIILDKLNKFAPKNYTEIHDFLCQILDSGQTTFMKEFMKVVFEKATREEMFCPHYVRLLCELSEKYGTILTEMVNLYREYSLVFDDISETTGGDSHEKVAEKNYRRGYSQFLAELVKYNVLDVELFVGTLQRIIGNIPVVAKTEGGKYTLDEYIDCLLRILKAIESERTSLANSLRTVLKERFVSVLEPLTIKNPDYVALSPKGRFGLIDIVRLIRAL